ncbi:lasso peptide biosynthesis B2 protein [Mesorhizobium atlanticum]
MTDGPVLRAVFRAHLWLSARLLPVLVGRRDFESVLKLAPLRSPAPYRELCLDLHRPARQPNGAAALVHARPQVSSRGSARLPFSCAWPVSTRSCVSASTSNRCTKPRLSAHCRVCLDGKPVVSDSQPGMVEIYRHPPSVKASAA